MMRPEASCSASNVPLKSFDKNSERETSPTEIFRKRGVAESSFASDRSGPGIPVPPVRPAVEPEPAMSLTRWRNQRRVPNNNFSGTVSPIRPSARSGTSITRNAPAVLTPYTLPVNCVKREKARPAGVGW